VITEEDVRASLERMAPMVDRQNADDSAYLSMAPNFDASIAFLAAQANATLQKALAAVQGAGGGVLFIPGNAPAGWTFGNNSQGMTRTPSPPAPPSSGV
jgi:hypothetical protein